jgi:hypothetical protein
MLNGIDRGLLHLGGKAPVNFEIVRQTVGADNELQYYVSALMSLAGLLRILGIRRVGRAWCGDAIQVIVRLAAADRGPLP